MKAHVHYDKEGDVLEVIFGKPTPEHYNDLGDDIFERVDEKTGKMTGFTIINLSKRKEPVEIPLKTEKKKLTSRR